MAASVEHLSANTAHSISNYMASVHGTAHLEAQLPLFYGPVTHCHMSSCNLESKLELMVAWTEEPPDYQATLTYIREHNYHCSSDKLQQLVVQHLFKLSKANLMGLGESIECCVTWMSILIYYNSRLLTSERPYGGHSKHAQRQFKLCLTSTMPSHHWWPTCSFLDWKQLMDYSFVSEFKLLNIHSCTRYHTWTLGCTCKLWTHYKVLQSHASTRRNQSCQHQNVQTTNFNPGWAYNVWGAY